MPFIYRFFIDGVEKFSFTTNTNFKKSKLKVTKEQVNT